MLVLGEIALDAFLFLAAERGVGEDDVDPVLLANVGKLVAEGVAGVNLGGIEAVQEEVHLAEEVRQRLGLAAEQAGLL